MSSSQVRIFRRFLIGLIAVVLGAVVYNYVEIWRSRLRPFQHAAKILSPDLLRSADRIEYSEHEDGKARFSIRAQRLVETREGKNLLEDIEAFGFNPDGSVRSEIRSREAEYDSRNKEAFFSKDVRIRMADGSELFTDSLHYNLSTDRGESGSLVKFQSSQITGTARGLRYDHSTQDVELMNEVALSLLRSVPEPSGAIRVEQLQARSRRAYYSNAMQHIRFEGDARLSSDRSGLSGEDIEVVLSPEKKRVRSLTSRGNAAYEWQDSIDQRALRGNSIIFIIDEDSGALHSIEVHGQALFRANGSGPEQELRADSIQLQLDAVAGTPLWLQCRKNVTFQFQSGIDELVLTGDWLEADFQKGTPLLERMTVREKAVMTRLRGSQPPDDELRAQEIRMRFRNSEDKASLEALEAEGSVRWVSSQRAREDEHHDPVRRLLTSTTLAMNYSAAGDSLEAATASGNVTIEDGASIHSSAHDERSLRADLVQFSFYPGENRLKQLDGKGHVQMRFRGSKGSSAGNENREYQTSSDHIRATFKEEDGTAGTVSQWGGFVFRDGSMTATAGKCDYDPGLGALVLMDSPKIADSNSFTTGDVVEYNQDQALVTVRRNVRSVLRPSGGKDAPLLPSTQSSAPSIVSAHQMRYRTDASLVHYDTNVQILSEDGQLQAQELDIRNGGEYVEAHGGVKHFIPNQSGASRSGAEGARKSEQGLMQAPVLIKSDGLKYSRMQNTIRYTGDVVLRSADLEITSSSLDAFMDTDGKTVRHATAAGNVFIRQAGREVRGDYGEFDSDSGQFVVLGNLAQISDPVRGKSFARRLTFRTADDRILLENSQASGP